MTARGISIKTRIIITLVLLPLVSLLVVGAIALLQNQNSLAAQAELNAAAQQLAAFYGDADRDQKGPRVLLVAGGKILPLRKQDGPFFREFVLVLARRDPALAVVDPAILVRRFLNPHPGPKYPVSFMPHLQSMPHADWEALCARIGFHCIDPRAGVAQVLEELQKTELLLAEAMHGAIVADALRVPWIPVRLYSRFAEFKWQDWSQSIRVPLKLTDIPPIYAQPPRGWKRLDYLVKKGLAHAGMGRNNWKRLGIRCSTGHEIDRSLEALSRVPEKQPAHLSNDKFLSELEARLLEKLSQLRSDWVKRPGPPRATIAG